MTRAQLDQIPDDLLREALTAKLRVFLANRGWFMSLSELDSERRRRNIHPFRRARTASPRHSFNEGATS